MTENNSLFWLDPTKVEEGMRFSIHPIGPIKVIMKFTSYNRLVMLVERIADGRRIIIKTFRFKDVPARMNTPGNLQVISDQITEYKGELRKAKVYTSFGMGFFFGEYNGEPVLIQLEDYAGTTCSDDLKTCDPGTAVEIVRAIIRCCVAPLFENAVHPFEPGHLCVGTDLNPRNFTWMRASGLANAFDVDLFPTKLWLQSARWGRAKGFYMLEHPEPEDDLVRKLGIFRHYNMAGLILNFWTNLTRVRPELSRMFYDELQGFLRQGGYSQVETDLDGYLIKGIPGLELGADLLQVGSWSKEKIEKILKPMGFADIFRIRGCGAAIAYARPESREITTGHGDRREKVFELVFKRSHFQNDRLHEDQVKEVKDLIFQMTLCPVQFR